MRYIIVSNGRISDYSFYKNIFNTSDYIICADGGAKHLIEMNVIPNVIIGDLDSIDKEHKQIYIEKKVKFYKFPSDKDATDTELALDFALSNKPSEIILLGAIGSRMDHSIANITLLKKILDNGIRGKVINENNEIHMLNDEFNEIILYGEENDYISIIPLSYKVKGITILGAKFPLKDAEIPIGSSLGISNEFNNDGVRIKIKEGLLLVIKARD
ncbi:thiamine diphosphokinase [Paramaledivibacter caminithermalis]|jgi:thiamine pyrophosphokinase|uniref:Thiamine diphosphokinase n=1 Tax=Paramaledivibacter caminithermalis (strain DSM 15212 / CIP 107654 / DViRD3) TaxID=1121301 RepID=A0A1M6NI03_PARC5|nr:thiamine diphosphokinase [Paramaledivibacter caminithermalis]SHJ95283.1 thiamine diphosphokinase [Paramaledivibacter caminithermalis DSM 15212]